VSGKASEQGVPIGFPSGVKVAVKVRGFLERELPLEAAIAHPERVV
jgi:hypothetical protein